MKPVTDQMRLMAVIFAVIGIFFAGYMIGVRTGSVDSSREAFEGSEGFRVIGDSMAPTIREGSLCKVAKSSRPLRIGDIVAVSWQGRERIKRVAAVAGNVVDLAGGRLLIDSRTLEDHLAERSAEPLPDRHEADWIPPAIVPVAGSLDAWSVIENDDGRPTPWLRFTYQNPHQGNRPTAIMDDYPENDSVQRKLNPVVHLIVHAQKGSRVAFYSNTSSVRLADCVDGVAKSRDASRIDIEVADENDRLLIRSLDASHPVAVRVAEESLERTRPQVFREIEYRDDKPTGAVSYPVRLKPGQVFLVGDNVPVSIDSRSVGPIGESAILGVVVKTRPPNRDDQIAGHE